MERFITFYFNHASGPWQALYCYVGLSFVLSFYLACCFIYEDLDMRFFNPWKRAGSKFGYNYKSAFSWIMMAATLPFINLIVGFFFFILPPIARWFHASKTGQKFEAWWEDKFPSPTQTEIEISRTNPFPGADPQVEKTVKKMIDNCVILFPDEHRFIIDKNQKLIIEGPDSGIISERPLIGLEKYLLSQIVVLQLKLMRAESKQKGK